MYYGYITAHSMTPLINVNPAHSYLKDLFLAYILKSYLISSFVPTFLNHIVKNQLGKVSKKIKINGWIYPTVI